jgi:hypothetical protein
MNKHAVWVCGCLLGLIAGMMGTMAIFSDHIGRGLLIFGGTVVIVMVGAAVHQDYEYWANKRKARE